jgi:hypothetical protein
MSLGAHQRKLSVLDIEKAADGWREGAREGASPPSAAFSMSSTDSLRWCAPRLMAAEPAAAATAATAATAHDDRR